MFLQHLIRGDTFGRKPVDEYPTTSLNHFSLVSTVMSTSSNMQGAQQSGEGCQWRAFIETSRKREGCRQLPISDVHPRV